MAKQRVDVVVLQTLSFIVSPHDMIIVSFEWQKVLVTGATITCRRFLCVLFIVGRVCGEEETGNIGRSGLLSHPFEDENLHHWIYYFRMNFPLFLIRLPAHLKPSNLGIKKLVYLTYRNKNAPTGGAFFLIAPFKLRAMIHCGVTELLLIGLKIHLHT